MADYGDWFESTFGGGMSNNYQDGDGEEDEGPSPSPPASGRYERDVVLCMVDCRPEMFQSMKRSCTSAEATPGAGAGGLGSAPPPLGNGGNPNHHHTTMTRTKRELDGEARESIMEEKEEEEDPVGTAPTPFAQALHAILQLYQEKVITSEQDVLGLLLYNTRQHYNSGNFPGVYVLQEFHLLNAQSIREVKELCTAGDPSSEDFVAFQETIGSSSGTEGDGGRISDALWAAQHLFMQRRLQQLRHKRVFLFTDHDEPTGGNAMELQRSYARARDLAQSGVELEVFSLGSSAGSGSFNAARFWEPLLRNAAEAAAATAASQLRAPTPSPSPSPAPYAGAVHHHECGENPLGALSEAVRVRAHRQVPFLKTRLRLGVRCAVPGMKPEAPTTARGGGGDGAPATPESSSSSPPQNDGLKSEADDPHQVPTRCGAAPIEPRVPTIAVSIYTPIIPAMGQPTTKIDAATNRRVARRSELVVVGESKMPGASRGPAGGWAGAGAGAGGEPQRRVRGRRSLQKISTR